MAQTQIQNLEKELKSQLNDVGHSNSNSNEEQVKFHEQISTLQDEGFP